MTELWLSLLPPVPGDQARPAGRRPVQHAGQRVGRGRVPGQVRGAERERGGQGSGVHGAADHQRVGAGRQGGDPALQGPVGGRGGGQQQRVGQRPHPGDLPGQVIGVLAVHGQVQAQPEQLALAAGDLVGQRAGVFGGGLGGRVVQPALPGPGAAGGFQPGALPPQPVRGHRGRDRLDVQRDVQPAGVGGQRLQPPGRDLGRVPGHRQGGCAVPVDLDMPGGDLRRRAGRAARPARRRARRPAAAPGRRGRAW